MIISQSQIASLIAFHLIRVWPNTIPPDLSKVLSQWVKHSALDFDSFGYRDIAEHELKSYLSITLNQDAKYREMSKRFDNIFFIKILYQSIVEEAKELIET